MLIGLLAGAVAAIVAALVSLPLHSPDDAFFNAASVTFAALVAGVAAGLLRERLPARTFPMLWAGACVAAVVALAASEAMLERMVEFGAPLAILVFAITGAIVHLGASRRIASLPLASLGGTVAALAIGIALAGQGDAPSGRLTLPAAPVASATAASSPGAASTAAASTAATGSTGATGGAASGTFTKLADVKGVTFAVGTGSEATFTVNEKLANLPAPSDAVMRTSALTGEIHLDGRPSVVHLDLSKLSSDQSRRDAFIQQSLFRTGKTATLTVPSLPDLPASYAPGQVVKSTVKGTLNINGADRPVSFDVEARIDGTTLNLVGRTSFVWADFGYRAPNTPTVSVQDKVTVEVLLVARAQQG